jgi:myo-inositol 2-dehydrogenase/D-chiro-inositol 1-dehydrogenase
MKKLKIALMGMGRIGKIHFRNIQQYFPQAEVVAVADPMWNKEDFNQQFGSVFFSADPAEAIGHKEVDAILICTPTSSHAELIEQGLASGKHIFCEKPMDLSLERTAMLVKKSKESRQKVMLGFNRRFDPDFMKAQKAVAEGAIGNLQIVKITSRDPGLPPIDYIKHSGGLFMDMAIHDFDMARYIMGKEVVEVFAKGLVCVDPAVKDAGDIDTALSTLTFEDGTYAVIDNSRKAVYGYDQRIEIFGSGGMIQVDNNLHHRNILFDEKGIHHSLPLDFFMDRYANSYRMEMSLFIRSITEDLPVPVGADDALKATQIAYAAKKSAAEGRPVTLKEIE